MKINKGDLNSSLLKQPPGFPPIKEDYLKAQQKTIINEFCEMAALKNQAILTAKRTKWVKSLNKANKTKYKVEQFFPPQGQLAITNVDPLTWSNMKIMSDPPPWEEQTSFQNGNFQDENFEKYNDGKPRLYPDLDDPSCFNDQSFTHDRSNNFDQNANYNEQSINYDYLQQLCDKLEVVMPDARQPKNGQPCPTGYFKMKNQAGNNGKTHNDNNNNKKGNGNYQSSNANNNSNNKHGQSGRNSYGVPTDQNNNRMNFGKKGGREDDHDQNNNNQNRRTISADILLPEDEDSQEDNSDDGNDDNNSSASMYGSTSRNVTNPIIVECPIVECPIVECCCNDNNDRQCQIHGNHTIGRQIRNSQRNNNNENNRGTSGGNGPQGPPLRGNSGYNQNRNNGPVRQGTASSASAMSLAQQTAAMSLTGTKILSENISFLAPHYQGNPKHLKSYLANASKINKTLGWTPQELCQYVTLSIRGDAGQWLQTIPSRERDTFAKLERALILKYMKPIDKITFIKHLSSLTQENTNVNVATFAQNVTEYVTDYYLRNGRVHNDIIQNKIREVFISGLHHELVKYLRIIYNKQLFQTPLDELVEAARSEESDLLARQKSGNKAYKIVAAINQNDNKPKGTKRSPKYIAALNGNNQPNGMQRPQGKSFPVRPQQWNNFQKGQNRSKSMQRPTYGKNSNNANYNENQFPQMQKPSYPNGFYEEQNNQTKREIRQAVFDQLKKYISNDMPRSNGLQSFDKRRSQSQNFGNNQYRNQRNSNNQNPNLVNNNNSRNSNNNNNNYYNGKTANANQNRQNRSGNVNGGNAKRFKDPKVATTKNFDPNRICNKHNISHNGVCPDTRCFLCGEYGHMAMHCKIRHCLVCEPHIRWHNFTRQCDLKKADNDWTFGSDEEQEMFDEEITKNAESWREIEQGSNSPHDYAYAN
jgi:hypothetical protein